MTTYKHRKQALQHMTVFGYIREQYKDVPDDLKHLCYQFYLKIFDEWNIDKSNDSLDIDVEAGIIEAKYKDTSIWASAFGSVGVKKGDIETWKIELLSKLSTT